MGTVMKELKCPECNHSPLIPPAEGKRKWTCPSCAAKFKIKSKDAGRILRHADEKGLDLGPLESFLISAILEKDKKRGKGKDKKGKKHKKVKGAVVSAESTDPSAGAPPVQ